MTNYSVPIEDSLLAANLLRHKRLYVEAIAEYQGVLSRFGDSSLVWRMIGLCQYGLALDNAAKSQRLFLEAEKSLLKAIELTPGNALLHGDLAEIYAMGLMRYDLAAKEYKATLDLQPDILRALLGASSLYWVPDEVVTLQEALDWMWSAIRIDPDNPHHHHNLVRLLKEANQREEAAKHRVAALLCGEPLSVNPNGPNPFD